MVYVFLGSYMVGWFLGNHWGTKKPLAPFELGEQTIHYVTGILCVGSFLMFFDLTPPSKVQFSLALLVAFPCMGIATGFCIMASTMVHHLKETSYSSLCDNLDVLSEKIDENNKETQKEVTLNTAEEKLRALLDKNKR